MQRPTLIPILMLAAACSRQGHEAPPPSPTAAPAATVEVKRPIASAQAVESAAPPRASASAAPADAGSALWQSCKRERRPSPQKVKSIRDADFCNFEFVPSLVSVYGGLGEMHEYMQMGAPHDTTLHKLTSVVYGDVNGDGKEDAVVGLEEENYPGSGGSGWGGTRSYLVIVKNGATVVAASGDAPPKSRLHLEGSYVVAEWSRGDELCRASYRLAGSSFPLAGKERCEKR